MLYTNYFSNIKNYDPTKVFAVTASKPEFLKGGYLKVVAPKYEWVEKYKNKEITADQYTEKYIAYLNANKEKILQVIKSLPDESMLCCYESPDKFCHRHVLAKWLNENKVKIIEFNEKFTKVYLF